MDYITHTIGASAGAIGIVYLCKKFDIPVDALHFIGGAVVGGLLPDIDHPKSYLGNIIEPLSAIIMATCGHRTITHSLLFMAIVGGLASFYNISFGIGIAIGILSHIALDMITPGTNGVAFLYPFKKERIKI